MDKGYIPKLTRVRLSILVKESREKHWASEVESNDKKGDNVGKRRNTIVSFCRYIHCFRLLPNTVLNRILYTTDSTEDGCIGLGYPKYCIISSITVVKSKNDHLFVVGKNQCGGSRTF